MTPMNTNDTPERLSPAADECLALIEDVGHGAMSDNVTVARGIVLAALSQNAAYSAEASSPAGVSCAAASGYVAWLLWCHDPHSTLNVDTLMRAYAGEGDARAECERLNEAEMDSYSYGVTSISVSPHTKS